MEDLTKDGGADVDAPVIQVVLADPMLAAFKQWLATRSWYLFEIPAADDDLPTYGIGIRVAS